MSAGGGAPRTEVERGAYRVLVEEVGGRRLRRFVVDCPRGRAKDLSDCGRCPDCRGYTLRSLQGSTVVCSLPSGEVPTGPAAGTVGAAMSRDVICLSPELPIGDALDLLVDSRQRAVPVVDHTDRPIGTLSGSDVLALLRSCGVAIPAAAEGLHASFDAALVPKELRSTPVQSVMKGGVATAREADPLDGARARMRQERLSRLMVVDAEGRTIGSLTAMDG